MVVCPGMSSSRWDGYWAVGWSLSTEMMGVVERGCLSPLKDLKYRKSAYSNRSQINLPFTLFFLAHVSPFGALHWPASEMKVREERC